MDFITDLPESCGYNAILTIVDRFSKLVKLVPVRMGGGLLSAGEVAKLLFDNIVCLSITEGQDQNDMVWVLRA